MSRVPGVKVTPYHGKIQDHDETYYSQFNLVVCGLDSIEARRWINATLVQMVDPEDADTVKPLIDGGTEGFKGQARVILPTITSCYECSVSALPLPRCNGSDCPVRSTCSRLRQRILFVPLPTHLVCQSTVLNGQAFSNGQKSSKVRWRGCLNTSLTASADKKLDNDDPDHIEWLYKRALSRANEFNIEGVTWALTQGVVKNIIPAIASTNAIIAGMYCAQVSREVQ